MLLNEDYSRPVTRRKSDALSIHGAGRVINLPHPFEHLHHNFEREFWRRCHWRLWCCMEFSLDSGPIDKHQSKLLTLLTHGVNCSSPAVVGAKNCSGFSSSPSPGSRGSSRSSSPYAVNKQGRALILPRVLRARSAKIWGTHVIVGSTDRHGSTPTDHVS